MELQHNAAPLEGAPTEPVATNDRPMRGFTNAELCQMMKGGGINRHVRVALKTLSVLMTQTGTGTSHRHLTRAPNFPEALRTRACLELIRRRTYDIEAVIRQREDEDLKRQRQQWAGFDPTEGSAE
jgi:hypothetical protein